MGLKHPPQVFYWQIKHTMETLIDSIVKGGVFFKVLINKVIDVELRFN
jgi:hypothetical protein